VKHNFQKKTQPQSIQRPQNSADAALEARKKLERETEQLVRQINQFRIDILRFFAGDLKLPPHELQERIKLELWRLQNSKAATSAHSFRLTSLEAKFNSHSELFARRLREREQGGAKRPVARAELHHHDPKAGIVFGAKPAEGAVEALFKGLYMSSGQRNPTMDLERFRGHISKQVETIRAKAGVDQIQFRIAEEDGKMKIKAKPIRKKG
jgi:hypothetical protein